MRRTRRTRVSTKRLQVVHKLVQLAINDDPIMDYLTNGERNRAFGRLINKWMDNTSKESVIDRYVDEDARDVTSYAINIINKQLREITA
jgi:hypothetical protein